MIQAGVMLKGDLVKVRREDVAGALVRDDLSEATEVMR